MQGQRSLVVGGGALPEERCHELLALALNPSSPTHITALMRAELMVLDANPLDDISNIHKQPLVMTEVESWKWRLFPPNR